MTAINRNRIGRVAGWLAPLLFMAGCSSDPTPPSALARASLERSLTAWKGGGRPGTVEGSEPPVQVVDSAWQAGHKLGSFEVLREEGGQGDRRFDVRLTQRDPAKTQEVRYVVLGKGPVWVYREEDYQRMINMDDNPAPAKPKKRRR